MAFTDKNIDCEDCGASFIHSATDQARYAERGFTHEPKRCRTCREKRKGSSGGGGGGDGGGGMGARRASAGGGGYGSRSSGGAPRETHEAVCAACGAKTSVPFKPTQGRPVYCRDCYRSQRG